MGAYEIMEHLLNLKEPKVYKPETYIDQNGDGNTYPYVLVAPDGMELEDDAVYSVVFAGITDEVAAESTMTDSGIIGLTAMKEYLEGVDALRPGSIVWSL